MNRSLDGAIRALPDGILDAQTIHHDLTLRRDTVMILAAAQRMLSADRSIVPLDALEAAHRQLDSVVDPTALDSALRIATGSRPGYHVEKFPGADTALSAFITRDTIRASLGLEAAVMRVRATEYLYEAKLAALAYQHAISIVGPPPTVDLARFRQNPAGDNLARQNISVGLVNHAVRAIRGWDYQGNGSDMAVNGYLREVTYPKPPECEDTNIETLLRAGGEQNYQAVARLLNRAAHIALRDIPKLARLASWDPLHVSLTERVRNAASQRVLTVS
jgi:hypothetical protein